MLMQHNVCGTDRLAEGAVEKSQVGQQPYLVSEEGWSLFQVCFGFDAEGNPASYLEIYRIFCNYVVQFRVY